ncbi:MAG: deoxynucleoside kinase [Candidatus Chromulinivorax sp.]
MIITKESKSIIVEGNIGAGKSTFLRLIKELLPGAQVVYEPHERWQDVGGENLLDYFYKDTSRWAYTFQSYAFITRIMAAQQAEKQFDSKLSILERSVYSDRYCFAKNAFEMGTMTALEWNLYQDWWSWFVRHYTKKPFGFIYLQTPPKVCYQRLLKRARSEEALVPLDYIQALHDKHESWLIKKENIEDYLQDIPVLVLDCTQSFEDNPELCKQFAQQIIDFFAFDCSLDLPMNKDVSLTL